MLSRGHPSPGWFGYLQGYVRGNLIVQMANSPPRDEKIETIFPKMLDGNDERYYYVRPGQPIGEEKEKFATQTMKDIYCYIKVNYTWRVCK